MKLLNTYEDKEKAEEALKKITGDKRLASERDGTETIYNLFGESTWLNFYNLELFNLHELKSILKNKKEGMQFSQERHSEIIKMLQYIAKSFDIEIPKHWL